MAVSCRFTTPRLCLAAALLMLAQLALAISACNVQYPIDSYARLYQWDSGWYGSIVEEGYHSTLPPAVQNRNLANVAFFPGYPLAASLVRTGLGITPRFALLLTAQTACFAFWLYVLLFLRRWRISMGLSALCLGLLMAHPAAFFLVAGYSESLFLVGLLGFLYWSSLPARRSWLLAAAHGIVMTATRLFGAPLVVIPVLDRLVSPRWKDQRALLNAGLLAGTASLGAVLFFAYCQVRFGCWNLYMETQRVGWKIVPNYLAAFDPTIYRPFMPNLERIDPNAISRATAPVMMLLMLGIAIIELALRNRLPAGRLRERLGFYAGAALLFGITMSALHCRHMVSVIRYSYCIHVLLVLGVTHLASFWQKESLFRSACVVAVIIVCQVLLWLQLTLAQIFMSGGWVA